jgi:hypothetical protein
MIRGHSTWLVVVLAGVLIAGCGSSSTPTTKSTSPATTATATPTTTSPTTTTTTTPASTTKSTAPTSTPNIPTSIPTTAAGVAEDVAVCKSIIQSEPTLAASVKAKVEGICNKAAHGNLAGARAAAKEVCVEVINASPIPSGPAKEKALAACKGS